MIELLGDIGFTLCAWFGAGVISWKLGGYSGILFCKVFKLGVKKDA